MTLSELRGEGAMRSMIIVAAAAAEMVSLPRASGSTINLSNPIFFVQPIIESTDGRQLAGSTPQKLTITSGLYSAGAKTAALPNPSVSGFATGGAQAGPGVSGAATIDAFVRYDFEVLAPIGFNSVVPLILRANGSATALNTGGLTFQMISSVGLNGVSRIDAACVAYDASCASFAGPTFSLDYSFVQRPNTTGSVDIAIQGLIANNSKVGASIGTISGFVDPVITIDPTFGEASELRLVFSPGIGDSPEISAPEPSSLILLGVAVAVLRAAKRKVSGLRDLTVPI